MPRVTLRTVDPAKELACQSVEKRCTRANASRATSDMILSVTGTNRSATVAPRSPQATIRVARGCLSQWRNTNGITTLIAAGRLLSIAVMAHSGDAHGASRLQFWTTREADRAQRRRL